MTSSNWNLTVYGCGNCGTNIAHKIQELHNSSEQNSGFANVKFSYLDTSGYNIDRKGLTKDAYVFKTTKNGSGKIRDSNVEAIEAELPTFMSRHSVTEFAIIINSAGGGSGSVIGPKLHQALLKKGVNVISICIGSISSAIETHNTVGTIKSYQKACNETDLPIVMHYLENFRNNQSEDDINSLAVYTVVSLMALFSGNNAPLDRQDLENWLNYQKIQKAFDPGVVMLTMHTSTQELENNESIIGVVSLGQEGSEITIPSGIEYHAKGYISPTTTHAGQPLIGKAPLHFVISDCVSDAFFNRLHKESKRLAEAAKTRIRKPKIECDDAV